MEVLVKSLVVSESAALTSQVSQSSIRIPSCCESTMLSLMSTRCAVGL